MTGAPAGIRRRGLAAAGVNPPRRPRAVRGRPHLAVAAALAVLAAGVTAVSACGASSVTPAGNVFTIRQQVSLQQVRSAINNLYASHPDIASFTVQDLAYTASSRDTVVRECTSGGAAASMQNAETGQVIACAPLIYFFYSYGTQASVPAAVTVAGDLYWYAITHITGPVSATTSLDELLQSWKLPVPGLTAAQASKVVANSVVTAANDAMLTQKSVRVVITDRLAGAASAQRVVADIGTVTGTELITYGSSATATIRVTRQAAYFTGNPAGLTAYLGLTAAAAARVRNRWVAITAGTSQYQSLATENTIASLPSSVLPSASDAPQAQTATIGGVKAYVLDWTATASGSSSAISARLIVSASPRVLPVSETITTTRETKTITFSRWGTPFTVIAPAPLIGYSQVTG